MLAEFETIGTGSSEMNRRQGLLKMVGGVAGLAGLGGCAVGTSNTDARVVMDDGVSDLTSAYSISHTLGESTVFARASFYYWNARQEVRLRDDGSVNVGGMQLERDPKALISYIGRPPYMKQPYTVIVTRMPGRVVSYRFDLPRLQVSTLPTRYSGDGALSVNVSLGEPADGLVRDRFGMAISAPTGEFRLAQSGVSSAQLSLDPIQRVPLPVGTYRAVISRVQRISLSKISAEKTGWCALATSQEFLIDIGV